MAASTRQFAAGLAGLLLLALAVRLAILASPLGEIDADEAIVGLMARHIAFHGERPVFFYNQPYLGSLEAFSAAPLFRLFDSSTVLLKLVPTVYSLVFVAVSAVLARRLFGTGPALATAAYLALPPVMLAVWSTKARGGYVELLVLGELLLLVTLWLAGKPSVRLAAVWGLIAGLSLWTHLLAVVYILPSVVYLVARRRGSWTRAEVAAVASAAVLGASPLLLANFSGGFLTVQALLRPADLPFNPAEQLARFFRIGIPVLAGLGQPTTSPDLFDRDWLTRPAGRWPVAAGLLLTLAAVTALHLKSVRRLFGRWPDASAGPALLVLLALAVPLFVALTRFGFFVSEPRYALPLYSAVPLAAAALWRLPLAIRSGVLALVLALNVWSIASTDVRLWRSEDALESTPETRAELVRHLEGQDRHQMYTDYWIGYPIVFETRERVLAYVISGGFNRYVPYAENVQRTPNPAWVFIPGSEAEREFLEKLNSLGGRARSEDVAVYRVYTDVEPLAAMRPAP